MSLGFNIKSFQIKTMKAYTHLTMSAEETGNHQDYLKYRSISNIINDETQIIFS